MGGLDDPGKIRYSEPGGNWRNDQPGKKAAYYPKTFPGPAFYFFVGNIKTARREAANKVENDTKYYLHGLRKKTDL